MRGSRVLGVDIDPEVVRQQADQHMQVRFGDAEDPEFIDTLPLKKVAWVVSTARERDVNMAMLKTLKREGYAGKIAVTASNNHDAAILHSAGADLVLRPFADAANQAVDWLLET